MKTDTLTAPCDPSRCETCGDPVSQCRQYADYQGQGAHETNPHRCSPVCDARFWRAMGRDAVAGLTLDDDGNIIVCPPVLSDPPSAWEAVPEMKAEAVRRGFHVSMFTGKTGSRVVLHHEDTGWVAAGASVDASEGEPAALARALELAVTA